MRGSREMEKALKKKLEKAGYADKPIEEILRWYGAD
jgi:hypothetical protein